MIKRISTGLIYLLTSINGFGQQTGSFNTSVQFMQETRTLSCYVPINYDDTQSYNLVIGLHGLGDESGNYRNALISSNWHTLFPNTIFVCPDGGSDGNSDFYFPVGDQEIIQEAINFARDEYEIDTNQIILQGFSLGGKSALCYGLDNPEKFKGLFLNTPALQGRADVENIIQPQPAVEFNYSNASEIPMYITVGTNDALYDYTLEGLYPILKKNNGIMKNSVISGLGHTLPASSYMLESDTFVEQSSLDSFSVDIFEIDIKNRTCENFINSKCLLRNIGHETLSSVEIKYSLDGVENSFVWTGNLLPFEHIEVDLPVINNLTDGAHVLECELGLLNGNYTDQTNSDDIQTISFYSGIPESNIPYFEDFEGDINDWHFEEHHNIFEWFLDDEVSKSGQNSLGVFNSPLYFNTQDLVESVYSPVIDLSSSTSPTLTLSFNLAYNYLKYAPPAATQDFTFADTLEIFISTDCGETYNSIYKNAGETLATASQPILNPLTIQACIFNPADTNWSKIEIDISGYSSQNEVRFKMAYSSNLGGSLYIDDFSINNEPLSSAELINPKMSIYPNPAKDFMKISHNKDEKLNLEIFSALGVNVFKNKVNTNERINISNLPAGSYIVKGYNATIEFSEVLIIE